MAEKDDDLNHYVARHEQQEETNRRHAIHAAMQRGGHVRSVFLREEDYVAHSTRVMDMEGDGFPIFWLTYVYGGEILEPFEQVGGQAGLNYFWRGTIVRRLPGPSNNPELVEPVILIDLDQCSGIVQVPPDVWQYAFEARPGERVLDLNPLSEKNLNSNRVFQNKDSWCPPKTTVHVILASARAGLLVKGPMTLLLVLAQAKVPLEVFGPPDAEALAEEWTQVWALQASCNALLANQPADNPDPVGGLGITLEFPKSRVHQLASIFGAGNLFLFYFVNEAWLLVTGQEKMDAASGDLSGLTLPTITADLARDPPYTRGQFFAWVPYLRQDCELALHEAWANTPRIARREKLGETYYLNTVYGATALPPTVRWAQVERMRFLKPTITHVRPVRFGGAGEPFPLRNIVSQELSAVLASLTEFATFWHQTFKRPLALVEHRGGWFLFRDTETETEEEPGASNDDEGPEVRETDVIVKDISPPFDIHGYFCGLQGYLDLLTPHGRPTRYFVFDPKAECTEFDATAVATIARDWARNSGPKINEIARRVVLQRETQFLDIDLLLGDVLTNLHAMAVMSAPEHVQCIKGAWYYDEEARTYVPTLEFDAELAPAKDAIEHALTQMGVKAGPKPHPAILHLELETLRKDHPETYAKLMQKLDALAERLELRQADPEDAIEDEDKDDIRPPDFDDPRRKWREVERTKYFVRYVDENGWEHIEDPEDFDGEAEYDDSDNYFKRGE